MVHFKWVKFMLSEFYPNKAVSNKQKENGKSRVSGEAVPVQKGQGSQWAASSPWVNRVAWLLPTKPTWSRADGERQCPERSNCDSHPGWIALVGWMASEMSDVFWTPLSWGVQNEHAQKKELVAISGEPAFPGSRVWKADRSKKSQMIRKYGDNCRRKKTKEV